MAFRFPPFSREPKANHEDRQWHITKNIHINKSLRVPVLILTAVLVYVAANFIVNHYNPVQTVEAAQYSLDDSFSVSGWFFREEEVINIAQGDTVEYNYSNGDKVGVHAALVTEYSSEEALATSRKLDIIRDNIEQLETLLNGSPASTNSSQIDKKIISQINSIMEETESGSLTQISSLCAELRQLALKSDSSANGSKDVEAELADLKKQAQVLQSSLDGQTSSTTSDKEGYFCDSIDGWEGAATLDAMENLSVATLDELSQQTHESEAGKGKLIVNFYWYFAAAVPNNSATRLNKGSSATLRFAQVSEDVPVQVYDIREQKNSDRTLVVFRSNTWNEDLVSMRSEVADVIINSYTGIRVPKDAVRMSGDQMGVYVLVNTVSNYKTITPIYESDDFYIVQQNVTGDDSLVVGDDIIVRAKDLDDKKVIK